MQLLQTLVSLGLVEPARPCGCARDVCNSYRSEDTLHKAIATFRPSPVGVTDEPLLLPVMQRSRSGTPTVDHVSAFSDEMSDHSRASLSQLVALHLATFTHQWVAASLAAVHV